VPKFIIEIEDTAAGTVRFEVKGGGADIGAPMSAAGELVVGFTAYAQALQRLGHNLIQKRQRAAQAAATVH